MAFGPITEAYRHGRASTASVFARSLVGPRSAQGDVAQSRTCTTSRRTRRPLFAFLAAIPIALLGGLTRLVEPSSGYQCLRAAPLPGQASRPLNLAISLVTLGTALVSRASPSTSRQWLTGPAIVAMIAGALVTAFLGPTLASRISNASLQRVILVLLVLIGSALIVESFLPTESGALVPIALFPVVAFILGLAIGLVSSLLGVAGGELIIPSFVFAFGAPIKIAGTASLLVSLPTVSVGNLRYWTRGAYRDPAALRWTVIPMGLGSVIGAVLGGLLLGAVPASILKVGLGIILIASAVRVFHHSRSSQAVGRR